MNPEITDNDPALKFLRSQQSPWIYGAAFGHVPQNDSAAAPPPHLLVFTGAAPDCELQPIAAAARQADPNAQLVTIGAFVGLQGTGVAIGASAPARPDVLPVAGTLGAIVEAPGGPYVLGSNHTMSFNGRAPIGSPIQEPGPVDQVGGGAPIATLSQVVMLNTTPDATPAAPPNLVDCALAKLTVPKPTGLQTVPVAPVAGAFGKKVHKVGRTSFKTNSTMWITGWAGLIDFTFGTALFQGLLGTYDPVVKDPFARPGDSGSCVRQDVDGNGLGLVMARAYVFDSTGAVAGTIILMCSLAAVAAALAPFFPAGSQITFESTV